MTVSTDGRSATEIRDAQRLYEALVIAQAPTHTEKCATHNEASCDCSFAIPFLWHRHIVRHAPHTVARVIPCQAHVDLPLYTQTPGFRCPECRTVLDTRCLACGDPSRGGLHDDAWPCDDVRVAASAFGLDEPGAVDTFLALPPESEL